MATLDAINQEKKGKKAKKGGMANAVSSTEKIRDWVSFFKEVLINYVVRAYN